MEMRIGTRIAELRRKQGFTQEQLAEKLGVSAPAVSKWETDSSYPDITLLCPLARALDTNVDTLLQYEESLSDEKATELMNEVLKTAFGSGYEASEKKILELLHQYPNCVTLKFHAAVIWDCFRMYFPTVDDEIKAAWAEQKKRLLQEVRQDRTSAYWQNATLQLAGILIGEGELEQGETLLKELPEHMVDPTAIWSLLYLKKEEPEEALRTVQKRLYLLVCQALSCLSMMMTPKVTPDHERALKICDTYKAMDELFGLGGMYDGLYMNLYLCMNRFEDAADCLSRYADVITAPLCAPKPFLFSPGVEIKEGPATTREIRELLLRGLKEEEAKPLLEYPQAQAAIEKIRASLSVPPSSEIVENM